jgi:DNA (cytosine-5)-methyltransferase 1
LPEKKACLLMGRYSLAFVGGFDLAAEWMGWENVFHCEWNEFGQKILKHYWPKAISYGDITKTDFTIHRGTVDILTGGFPCQPYSLAGKRKGKEDDRHLWPEMLRTIHEIQPSFVVGENVPGLINWSGGLVFEEVQSQMEVEGYEVIPFILPACGVNAPHKRERIWFIAYRCGESFKQNIRREWGFNSRKRDEVGKVNTTNGSIRITPDSRSVGRQSGPIIRGEVSKESWSPEFNIRNIAPTTSDPGLQRQEVRQEQTAGIEQCDEGINSNTCNQGLQRNELTGTFRQSRTKTYDTTTKRTEIQSWDQWPTQSPLCSRDDGISSRLDGITFPKWRNESIKAMGNAIVPQVAYQIFKAIEEFQIMSEKHKP